MKFVVNTDGGLEQGLNRAGFLVDMELGAVCWNYSNLHPAIVWWELDFFPSEADIAHIQQEAFRALIREGYGNLFERERPEKLARIITKCWLWTRVRGDCPNSKAWEEFSVDCYVKSCYFA